MWGLFKRPVPVNGASRSLAGRGHGFIDQTGEVLLHRIPVGREHSSIEAIREAAALHTLENADVFKIKVMPILDDGISSCPELLTVSSFTRKVETDRFSTGLGTDGCRDQGRQLVGKDLEREIWKEHKPVAAVFLVLRQVREVGEALSAGRVGSLEGIAAQQNVIFKGGRIPFRHSDKRVQPGMTGEDMIGLNEVLYRELPVGFDIKTQSAAQTKRVKVVISDFFKQKTAYEI